MLNYIWLALIFLGISAALVSDIKDDITNKYHNDDSVNVFLEIPNVNSENDSASEATLLITPDSFNNVFSTSLKDTLKFKVKISPVSGETLSNVYLKINNDSPPILKEMAEVHDEKDDLNASIINLQFVNEGSARGKLIFEKIGFVKLSNVTKAALDYAGIAVEIVLGLIGIMALWLGIMKIAEEAGIIKYIAIAARPLTKFLFPDVPPDHPAIGSIIMNISATFLGLGNAATPFGIKAMEDLNTLNPNKDTATNAMCTFLVINTASFALMPTTAIALRAAAGSSQPAIIIGTTMFGSLCATIVGITVTKIFEKFPFSFVDILYWIKRHFLFLAISFAAVILLSALSFTGMYNYFGSVLSFLNPELLKNIIEIISTLAIPLIIFSFVLLGIIKKVKIYETFVVGAKEGFSIAVTIIPYLVAILVAIGIFRAGGGMDYLIYLLDPITQFIGMPSEAIPMALMRPLSGSGSLGIMAEIISVHGPDSFIGILVSTMFGSTETTFYVLAVYFGAVNIKNTRYALPAGLISDVAGILAALFIVKLLFT